MKERPGPPPAAPAPDPAASARRALRLVIIAYLFLAALYASAIPPGKGADETAHMRYLAWLAEEHRLPVFSTKAPGADYEFHQPPLFYLTALPTYLLAGREGDVALQAVRFVSILLGLPLLYLTFGLGRTLAPHRPWAALAATAVVAFLPMHLGLVASVSNDVLTEVFFAAVLLLMVRHLAAASAPRAEAARPPGAAPMAIAGLLTGLGLLTKSSAILLLPVIWTATLMGARGPAGREWARAAREAALATVIALAVAGWWLVRNQLLYGDPLAQRAFLSAFQDRPSPQDFIAAYMGGDAPRSLKLTLYAAQVAAWTFASGIGAFGPVFANRFVFYPAWVYLAFGLKAMAEAGGFLRYLRQEELADWQRQAWWLCALLGALVLASFIGFNLSFFQAQARYLFPALPAIALALSLGLEQLAPPRLRPAVLAGGVGLLLLLGIAGLPLWVVPQFAIPLPPDLVVGR